MPRPPVLAAMLALAATLALAACGGDDDETVSIPEGASGTSGAQGAELSGTLTAGEFLRLPIPDQLNAVENAVEDEPDCGDVDTSAGGDFQVEVAINAAAATPATPLSEVVMKGC